MEESSKFPAIPYVLNIYQKEHHDGVSVSRIAEDAYDSVETANNHLLSMLNEVSFSDEAFIVNGCVLQHGKFTPEELRNYILQDEERDARL